MMFPSTPIPNQGVHTTAAMELSVSERASNDCPSGPFTHALNSVQSTWLVFAHAAALPGMVVWSDIMQSSNRHHLSYAPLPVMLRAQSMFSAPWQSNVSSPQFHLSVSLRDTANHVSKSTIAAKSGLLITTVSNWDEKSPHAPHHACSNTRTATFGGLAAAAAPPITARHTRDDRKTWARGPLELENMVEVIGSPRPETNRKQKNKRGRRQRKLIPLFWGTTNNRAVTVLR